VIDDRFAKPWPHRCNPHAVPHADPDRVPNGARWICDECGTGWVLTKPRPDSLPYWDPETPKERRQRLRADQKARR